MPHSRFFLDAVFHPQERVLLEADEAHHLLRVMRKQQGEIVELVNGRHQLARAQIIDLQKRSVSLQLLAIETAPPSNFPIILCQAIPRLNHLDWIVEKGVELGMTALWLFPTERSEKKSLSPTQLNRLHAIAIGAMKQSGRLDLPTILLKPPLSAWSTLDFPAYFGDLQNAPSFLTAFEKKEGVFFFVGPEAGFTEEEIATLRSLHVRGVSLGRYILRTETAAVSALAIINNK